MVRLNHVLQHSSVLRDTCRLLAVEDFGMDRLNRVLSATNSSLVSLINACSAGVPGPERAADACEDQGCFKVWT